MVYLMYLPRQDQPLCVIDSLKVRTPQNISWCRPLLAVDCNMAVTQQCGADIVDVEGWNIQRSLRLRRDSSVVRALVRKTKGPGFDPQLCCLNFSFLRPSVSAFFLRLVCWNGLVDVFAQSGPALSCVIICKSVHRMTYYGDGRCWL